MKKFLIEQEILAYHTAVLANDNDLGRFGKVLEVETRDFILARGIRSIQDVKARKLGKVDVKARGVKVEIKSGSGSVCYAELDGFGNPIKPFTKEDLRAENVLSDSGLVVWYPFPKIAVNSPRKFEMGFVFEREQFVDMLTAIGKKGLQSSLKVSKHGAQINIQTISPAIEQRMWEYLEMNEIPSVAEFYGMGQ